MILIDNIDMPKDKIIRIEIEPDGTVWVEEYDWAVHKNSAKQIDK